MYINKLYTLIFIYIFSINNLYPAEKDTIFAVNSISNTLYLGIDNYIHVPEYFLDDSIYIYNTDNGLIYKDSVFLNIIPRKRPESYLYIYEKSDTDTILIVKTRFFVKYVPKTCILLNNKCLDDIKYIDRNAFLKNPEFVIYISEDIIGAQEWLKIKRFTIGYSSNGIFKSFEAEGNTLTKEMKELIELVKPEQEIKIQFIMESMDILIRNIPVYTLIVK